MEKKIKVQLRVGDYFVQELALTPSQVDKLLDFIRRLIIENISGEETIFFSRTLDSFILQEMVENKQEDTIKLRWPDGNEVLIKYSKKKIFFKPRNWSITTATKFPLTFEEVADLLKKTDEISDTDLVKFVQEWIKISLKPRKEWLAERLASFSAVLCIAKFLEHLRKDKKLRSLILKEVS